MGDLSQTPRRSEPSDRHEVERDKTVDERSFLRRERWEFVPENVTSEWTAVAGFDKLQGADRSRDMG